MFWREKSKGILGEWLVLLFIAFFFLALYLPKLGDYGLYDPWETHYGEVARQMVESENYIDPYWGSPWDDHGVKREREGFYSKPPFTMWMMALGMKIFGYHALGVRFFFPILTILAIFSVYLALSRIVNRRTGLIASLIYGLNPFTVFLSHQAVTDTPLLSLITMGMMSLSLAFYEGNDTNASAEEPKNSFLHLFTFSFLLLIITLHFWIIWPMDRSPDQVNSGWRWFIDVFIVFAGKGWTWTLTLLPLALLTLFKVWQMKQKSMLYFVLFYVFCGLTVPAKGWLGWAPMGGALLLYLLITQEWSWFKKARPGIGLLIVFFTGHIWVVAMLGGHHPEWLTRFIYHDHINRLFSGVHSTDDGAFEYFLQWIGYGLFPMIALLPAAFSRSIAQLSTPIKLWDQKQKFELLMYLWAIFGFFLFSKSSTKFHHYILPVIPAFVILIALWIDDLLDDQIKKRSLFVVSAIGVLIWVGMDVYREPKSNMQGAHHWVNLFTYKYDREWLVPESDVKKIQTLREDALKKAWQSELSVPFFDPTPQNYDQANPKTFETTTTIDPFWHKDLMKDEAYAKVQIANAWHESFTPYLRTSLLLGLLALLVLLFKRFTQIALYIGLSSCLVMAIFAIYDYLPKLSRHWSQQDIWDIYDQQCEIFNPSDLSPQDPDFEAKRTQRYQSHLLVHTSRVPAQLDTFPRKWCKEPVIAFRMNWRGETFYSSNTVVPILETKYFKTLLESWGIWNEWQEGKEFYLFSERARVKSELNMNLPTYMKGEEWRTELLGEDRKVVLFRFAPPKGWKAKQK
jgi:4-amino-4-deoxy-L-arabinose transferase-like glycosyltransferase